MVQSEAERVNAADLRVELLLGNVPADVSALLTLKAVPQRLNVSQRTVYRLVDSQATPATVRLDNPLNMLKLLT